MIAPWIWFAGVLAFAGLVIGESVLFAVRIRGQRPLTDPAVLEVLSECRRAMGLPPTHHRHRDVGRSQPVAVRLLPAPLAAARGRCRHAGPGRIAFRLAARTGPSQAARHSCELDDDGPAGASLVQSGLVVCVSPDAWRPGTGVRRAGPVPRAAGRVKGVRAHDCPVARTGAPGAARAEYGRHSRGQGPTQTEDHHD